MRMDILQDVPKGSVHTALKWKDAQSEQRLWLILWKSRLELKPVKICFCGVVTPFHRLLSIHWSIRYAREGVIWVWIFLFPKLKSSPLFVWLIGWLVHSIIRKSGLLCRNFWLSEIIWRNQCLWFKYFFNMCSWCWNLKQQFSCTDKSVSRGRGYHKIFLLNATVCVYRFMYFVYQDIFSNVRVLKSVSSPFCDT